MKILYKTLINLMFLILFSSLLSNNLMAQEKNQSNDPNASFVPPGPVTSSSSSTSQSSVTTVPTPPPTPSKRVAQPKITPKVAPKTTPSKSPPSVKDQKKGTADTKPTANKKETSKENSKTPAAESSAAGSCGGSWINKKENAFARKDKDYWVIATLKNKKNSEVLTSKKVKIPKLEAKPDCNLNLQITDNSDKNGKSVIFDASKSSKDCPKDKSTPAKSEEITWVIKCGESAPATQTGLKITVVKKDVDCDIDVTYRPKDWDGEPAKDSKNVPAKEKIEKEDSPPPINIPDSPEPKIYPNSPPPQLRQQQYIPKKGYGVGPGYN